MKELKPKELKPVFNNCPYLYEVAFNECECNIYVFAETEVGAIQIASTQIIEEIRTLSTEKICFANDIINLNKVFK